MGGPTLWAVQALFTLSDKKEITYELVVPINNGHMTKHILM